MKRAYMYFMCASSCLSYTVCCFFVSLVFFFVGFGVQVITIIVLLLTPVVAQLELDIRQWQEEQHCARLPTADEHNVLFKRTANYCNKEKSMRCRSMRAAYPAGVESI